MLKLGAPPSSGDKKPASKPSSKQVLNLLLVIKREEFTHTEAGPAQPDTEIQARETEL